MKAGILTFHRAENYGAALQAYGLQQALKKVNIHSDIIDYRCERIDAMYSLRLNPRLIKDSLSLVCHYPLRISKKRKFRKFRSEFLEVSKLKSITKYNLHSVLPDYDLFISGSDQVWNYHLTNFDKTYFLDFVPNNEIKCSYAASFGFDSLPGEYVDAYRALLSSFKWISVREKQGAKIVVELINRDPVVLLDPTLLLTLDEWIQVSSNPGREHYILLYLMVYSPLIIEFAETLSRKTGLRLLFISDSLLKQCRATYIRGIGPSEWLGLFLNADYIVTNSFHGVAFSINFNKQFFVELLPEPAIVNSRLENILDMFNLRDRQIKRVKNCDILINLPYEEINESLEKERLLSFSYLKQLVR